MQLSIIGKRLGIFSLHDVIRFEIINMLPLFVSYPLIKYVLRLEIQDYFGVATLMGLIVFVQTMTFLSIILCSICNLFYLPNPNDDQTNNEKKSFELTEVEVDGTPKYDQILELKKQNDELMKVQSNGLAKPQLAASKETLFGDCPGKVFNTH